MAYRTWLRASGIEDDQNEAETRKGPWTLEEDAQLLGYISLHGEGRWSFLAKAAGLKRTGRSCRLRWVNCLRPDLKRSKITSEEERLIIELHGRWGNRWSHIARSLPGRTDNEIKNYWRTRIKGKVNLQVDSDDRGMDADDRVDFERSLGSYCLPTSSQIPPDHDRVVPSTSFPAQSTQEVAVQRNKRSYPQDDISPQVIPIHELNDESELPRETRHGPSQTNDDGQPDAASYQDLEDPCDQPFENSLPYNFPVGSVASLLYSFDFCGIGATQDDRIPVSSSYMVASSEDYSDSEAYLNHDRVVPSTSFPAQSTQEVAVQRNKRSYPQDDISPQVIPIHELNDESELPRETRHGTFQTNDDGQPDAASHQDLEDPSYQPFENSLPYNFPVGSVASLLYSFDFCGIGATQDDRIPVSSSYMVASSEDYSDSEAYLNHDRVVPSTSFPAQSTQEVAVQRNKRSYPQDDISPQVIPIHELNDESELPRETRHGPSQTNDDGQPDAASHQDLEDSCYQPFENSLPYNFPVGSVASLLYSFDFCGIGATQDDRIPVSSSYMVASSEDYSDSEAYLNHYSDELWNMDEEDDRFNGRKHSVSVYRNDRRSY